ncbi:MAG TPA: hypothetical protein VM242_04120 [Acidimicrobiales bacterium]|nr:hypothetical protein [Acidimicrobiales bacterium]
MTTEGAGELARDDRLLAPTWWTAVCIVPVLVAAWVVLYLFPGRTEQLWAWTIQPDMTPLVMGGGYLAGAYFFVRVARDRRWHEVAVGFLAITVFTTVLLAATVLHWDRFNHDHVSFWAWLSLYVVTPPLLPLLWRNNRRTDPGRLVAGDVRVPLRLRRLIAAGGAAQLCFAAAMFLAPGATAERWPWAVTPLTVRTISAFVAFPAVAWVCFAFEDRWSALRVPMQTATIGLVLIGAGALRATGDFDGPTWSVRLFPVALLTTIGLLVALQVAMDRRRAAGAASAG